MSKKAKKQDAQAAPQDESPSEEELMMLQALEEMDAAEVESAAGAEVDPDHAPAPRPSRRGRLAALYDLTLPVSIELGRSEMLIEDVLKIGRGSVIELDRLAGEPIDIYVGDRIFAEGEVVVVDEHFGVRVTRVLDTSFDEETAN